MESDKEIMGTADITSFNLLQEKSRYEITYSQFMEWRLKKQINSFSEQDLLAYFEDLSTRCKSNTLWTYYSMLRRTLKIHHNIRIEEYQKLRIFLKRKNENYQPKKAKTLSPEQINKFIAEAPDAKYLATKVGLIMGIVGSCSKHELYAMQVQDIQDLNTSFSVTVPNTRTKVTRRFTLTDNFYKICKKYLSLRPRNVSTSTFFLNYQKGKCTIQRIGINKIGGMVKEVAIYLKLPNPELYTSHCFRKSLGTLLVSGRGDITESTSYIDESKGGAEAMPELHWKREKKSSSTQTSEITTQELAVDEAIKTEVESDNEIDDCIKIESFFETEDDTSIEVKTEILDIKTEMESSEPRCSSRATSVSPDHIMSGSRNLVNEEIDNCKKRIQVLEQIQLRQSKKIKELENLLRYK